MPIALLFASSTAYSASARRRGMLAVRGGQSAENGFFQRLFL